MFSLQANLVLILSTRSRDERLSQPCLPPGSNPEPVAWQRKVLITAPPGFTYKCTTLVQITHLCHSQSFIQEKFGYWVSCVLSLEKFHIYNSEIAFKKLSYEKQHDITPS